MSVDNSAKTITVKFNGAPPESYYFAVSSVHYGRMSTSLITFKTSSTITAITTPTSATDSSLGGSALGGTLLTITGTNFSPAAGDMSVKVGPTWCDVQSNTATEIVCRIRRTTYAATDIVIADVLVFLAASFESTCMPDVSVCKFNFRAPRSTISSLTPSFNAATNTAIVTANGSSLPLDVSGAHLYIDGVLQTTTSSTASSTVFTITSLKSSSSTKIGMFVADGLPNGFENISSLTFTPAFVSVSPNTGGSAGGTLLTVTGTGFGVDTTGLGINKGTTPLCAKVTVTGYGSFTCMTNPVEVLSTDVLKLAVGTSSYACSNSVAANCAHEALLASSPNVSAVALSGNTITYTGTNFPSSADHTATALFKSAEVSVSSWTSTEVVATFTNGLPVATAAEAVAPKIRFTRTADSVQFLTTHTPGVSL